MASLDRCVEPLLLGEYQMANQPDSIVSGNSIVWTGIIVSPPGGISLPRFIYSRPIVLFLQGTFALARVGR